MIYHASMRTDISAFYSDWFYNRIKQRFFYVRNPYNNVISKHSLDTNVTDLLMFCSKNPEPMLKKIDLLNSYKQSWHITITPYGKDMEKNVPNKNDIIKAVKFLSHKIGSTNICWRYDPIIVTDKYNVDFHISAFTKMVKLLKNAVNCVIISFVHIYRKVGFLAPFINEVSYEDKMLIIKRFSKIANNNRLHIKLCGQVIPTLSDIIDQSGCETLTQLQQRIGYSIKLPLQKPKRRECSCFLGLDIGSYNCCPHLCRYCYANNQTKEVSFAFNNHNPDSPILIGNIDGNIIKSSKDISYKCTEMEPELF